ncbi:MAG: hypothetical protein ACI30D_02360 [Muribaculaceae bacterium]|nr:hypothetical protein [Muribaculaceae bacterium]
MKQDNDILREAGRRDGLAVPDGFFDDFVQKMSASLPENPAAEHPQAKVLHRSVWSRIRPYVYMAAMFAGIWCMLKMFSIMSPANVDLSIENNEALTNALRDDNFIYDYIIDDVSDREIMEEMYEDSVTVDDLLPTDSLILRDGDGSSDDSI